MGNVNVTYKDLTPAEKAKIQAHIQQAMAKINYNLNAQAGVVTLAQGSTGGISSHGPGHVGVSMGPSTKQPQDKVLRLVTSRYNKKLVLTSCVIWSVYIGCFSTLSGATMAFGKWWAVPVTLLPIMLGGGFLYYWTNKFFKEAEAKADLLEWPQK